MSGTPYYVDEANLDTFSDASSHRLYTYAVPEDAAGKLNIQVIARRVSDGATRVLEIDTLVKRSSGDADVTPSVPVDMATVADALALATLVVSVDNDGADVAVDVTGIASTEIDWSARVGGCLVGHV